MGRLGGRIEARLCRRALVVGMGALLVWLVGGCGSRQGEPQRQVVARVNGQSITKQELYDFLETVDNGDAARRALDALIVRQLIRQDAEKKSIKVSAEDIEARMEGMRDYVLATTGKDFDAWLSDTGQIRSDLDARLSLQILTSRLVIPDRDRREFFETNKTRLNELPHNNESVIYRQIVVPSKEEAEAIRKQLAADKSMSFAKLAEEKSLDPMTRSRGGMVGWASKGKMTPPDPELEKVLFSLKAGEISQVLPVPGGVTASAPAGQKAPERWRIVKVEKHIAPHEITLEDNQDVIEEWMLSDPRFQMQLQQFFTNLRAQGKVEIVDARYKLLSEIYEKSQQTPQTTMPPAPLPSEAPRTAPSRRPGRRGG